MEVLNLSDLKADQSMLIIIDMNNGYAKKGNMYTDRAKAIITPVVSLAEKTISKGIKTVAYTDCHPEDAKEFDTYPPHCIVGSEEVDLVDGLKDLGNVGLEIYEKNSTNGILAYNPARAIVGIENYIIVGCLTDVNIYQYAITLRAYLNEHNLEGHVIVSRDHVATYDSDSHEGDLYERMALKSMEQNGIRVVDRVE